MNQQIQEQLNQVKAELVGAKSKAFDTITQLTDTANEAKNLSVQWQQVLEKIAIMLKLETPTIDQIFAKIESLMKMEEANAVLNKTEEEE